MELKRNIRKTIELGVSATIIVTLLAGCFGSGGGGTAAGGGTPLIVTPALGQVYRGQVTVTGRNGMTRRYSIASGVPTVTTDITGMTAPLLIALTGDSANGDRLEFFDEGLGAITSSVVSSAASVRAIVPSVTGLSASGVGVTPLTEIAAATVANASGIVDISTLSAASAVGANTAGLALAQKLSGSTAITDVLTPPTPVKALGATLDATTAGDLYAKVLHTLANLPAATYGANAFDKARSLGDSVIANGVLTSTFDVDIGTANTAAAAGYAGTAPVPTAANADFKAMMDMAAQALPASAVSVAQQKAVQSSVMAAAFNMAIGSAPIDRTSPAFASAVSSTKTLAASAFAAIQASITAGAGTSSTQSTCQASGGMWEPLLSICLSGSGGGTAGGTTNTGSTIAVTNTCGSTSAGTATSNFFADIGSCGLGTLMPAPASTFALLMTGTANGNAGYTNGVGKLYTLAGTTWGTPTNVPTGVMLSANGWQPVASTGTFSAITATGFDEATTGGVTRRTSNMVYTNLAGTPVDCTSVTGSACPVAGNYPAGAASYAHDQVPVTDEYTLDTNSILTNASLAVTDANGTALTALPTLGTTTFCVDSGFGGIDVFIPAAAAATNYNRISAAGSCNASSITAAQQNTGMPVQLSTKATGLGNVSVIASTVNISQIFALYNGNVYAGTFQPAGGIQTVGGQNVSSSNQAVLKNKTAINAELGALGSTMIP